MKYATMVDPHLDPLDRLDHEVRQIILRDPVPKIGRKQKRLVPLAVGLARKIHEKLPPNSNNVL